MTQSVDVVVHKRKRHQRLGSEQERRSELKVLHRLDVAREVPRSGEQPDRRRVQSYTHDDARRTMRQ